MNFGKVDFNGQAPLYKQISEIIESKILSNEIAIGQKLPAQEDLRKIYNVSLNTIKEAVSTLAQKGYVACRPTHGTFVISSKPPLADLKIKNEIALVHCSSNLLSADKIGSEVSLSYKITRGVEARVRQQGMYLVYIEMEGDNLSLEGKEKDLAGIILAGSITRSQLNVVKKTGIPFVLLGDLSGKEKTSEAADIITDDDFSATYLAAKHLTGLGHRNIAYIAVFLDKLSWNIDHANGYIKALEEAGIRCDRELMVETGVFDVETARVKISELLVKAARMRERTSVPFTGLVSCNISLARGAIKAFEENGLKVPEDISIVNAGSPDDFLTTVASDHIKKGNFAVERLLYRLSNAGWKPERLTMAKELLVGNSTRQIKTAEVIQ